MHLSVSHSSLFVLPLGSIASFFSIFVPLEVRFLAWRKLKCHFVPLEVLFGLGKAQMSFVPLEVRFLAWGKLKFGNIWGKRGSAAQTPHLV